MKVTLPILGLFLALVSVQPAFAQAGPQGPGKTSNSSAEQEVITLSKNKWQWMAERNVEALDKLLAEEAVFVHMGATMTKSQELDTIKSGRIQYKDAQIQGLRALRRHDGHPPQQNPASGGGGRQRSGQPVQRHRGVREARRGVEARLALVHSADDPAGTVRAACTAVIGPYDRPQFVTPAVAKLKEFFGRALSAEGTTGSLPARPTAAPLARTDFASLLFKQGWNRWA